MEIETAAGFVIGVVAGFEAVGLDGIFGCIKVIDGDGKVVQARHPRVAGGRIGERFSGVIERNIAGVGAYVDGVPTCDGIALPADMPAKELFHPLGSGGGVADGDVGVFKLCGTVGHGFGLSYCGSCFISVISKPNFRSRYF